MSPSAWAKVDIFHLCAPVFSAMNNHVRTWRRPRCRLMSYFYAMAATAQVARGASKNLYSHHGAT